MLLILGVVDVLATGDNITLSISADVNWNIHDAVAQSRCVIVVYPNGLRPDRHGACPIYVNKMTCRIWQYRPNGHMENVPMDI